MPRSTRRATTAQLMVVKENPTNSDPSSEENVITAPNKKARHRLTTAELTQLEDMFRQETHPSRQQKKDLATQLGMDYKTVTIWFQNRRQTAKRSQLSVERPDLKRTRGDSCLRTVSSPSQNATLDVSATDTNGNTVVSKAIIKIKPLFDSLNMMARTQPHSESQTKASADDVPDARDVDLHQPQIVSEITTNSVEVNRHDQTAKQEQTEEGTRPVRWKKIRTLEWACERQTKRRKSSKEPGRLGSPEIQEDARMDSALSLLSLAASTQKDSRQDVMRGVSLLLSFKHSWRERQHDRR